MSVAMLLVGAIIGYALAQYVNPRNGVSVKSGGKEKDTQSKNNQEGELNILSDENEKLKKFNKEISQKNDEYVVKIEKLTRVIKDLEDKEGDSSDDLDLAKKKVARLEQRIRELECENKEWEDACKTLKERFNVE